MAPYKQAFQQALHSQYCNIEHSFTEPWKINKVLSEDLMRSEFKAGSRSLPSIHMQSPCHHPRLQTSYRFGSSPACPLGHTSGCMHTEGKAAIMCKYACGGRGKQVSVGPDLCSPASPQSTAQVHTAPPSSHSDPVSAIHIVIPPCTCFLCRSFCPFALSLCCCLLPPLSASHWAHSRAT